MSFQIKNNYDRAITINELDKEVCEIWKVEVNEKNYAVPVSRKDSKSNIEYLRQINWFDSIGWDIHDSKADNWDTVIDYFKEMYKDIFEEYPEVTLDDLIPKELEVIINWKVKGYIPCYVD